MTPALLRKIKELAMAGATILGMPPRKSPSLEDFPQCDREVEQRASEIWGDCDGKTVLQHKVGMGRVVWSAEPEKFLRESGIEPDFQSGEALRYIHRATATEDVYFVANPSQRDLTTAATFRVSGKLPELWWPDTGRLGRAPISQEENGRTGVLLPLGPAGSVFVVFRAEKGATIPLSASVMMANLCFRRAKTTGAHPNRARNIRCARRCKPHRDVRDKVQARVEGGESSFPSARHG